MTLRFGYWLPVFGGWLRNVEEEGMPATWDYVRKLALRSEQRVRLEDYSFRIAGSGPGSSGSHASLPIGSTNSSGRVWG